MSKSSLLFGGSSGRHCGDRRHMLQELMSGNKDLDQQVRIIIFSNEFCSNSGICH